MRAAPSVVVVETLVGTFNEDFAALQAAWQPGVIA
jgi:hypothetical protein